MNEDGPIVVAYDGSAAARASIALAGVHLVKDRKMLVLSVFQPIESVPFIGNPGVQIPDGMDDQIHAAVEKLAEEGAELGRTGGFDATGYVGPLHETVWQTIVRFADEHDASVILMGTHGRSGVKAVLLGSTASAVMHHAGRPVAVVPESYVTSS
jgi:nucleotide-binding universal stress UspA family protein